MSVDPEIDIARAHSAYAHRVHTRQRLERRAGRAAKNYGQVKIDLDHEMRLDLTRLSLDDLARAASRIQRLARMLLAANALNDARRAEEEAHAELAKVRAAAPPLLHPAHKR